MDCNKWEETGLLFSSGELPNAEAETYKEHLNVCATCADEYASYTSMKEKMFSVEVLGAQPSAACDAEIIRVCSDLRKPVTTVSSFSLVVKRTLISLTLFVFGFLSVSYVTIRMNGNNVKQSIQVAATEKPVTTDSVNANVSDSTSDSALSSGVNYAKTRGNLGIRGVVPVDLQSK